MAVKDLGTWAQGMRDKHNTPAPAPTPPPQQNIIKPPPTGGSSLSQSQISQIAQASRDKHNGTQTVQSPSNGGGGSISTPVPQQQQANPWGDFDFQGMLNNALGGFQTMFQQQFDAQRQSYEKMLNDLKAQNSYNNSQITGGNRYPTGTVDIKSAFTPGASSNTNGYTDSNLVTNNLFNNYLKNIYQGGF